MNHKSRAAKANIAQALKELGMMIIDDSDDVLAVKNQVFLNTMASMETTLKHHAWLKRKHCDDDNDARRMMSQTE